MTHAAIATADRQPLRATIMFRTPLLFNALRATASSLILTHRRYGACHHTTLCHFDVDHAWHRHGHDASHVTAEDVACYDERCLFTSQHTFY